MKNKILTTVSAIALMGVMPTFAEAAKTQTEINAEASTSDNISEYAKKTWENIKGGSADAYEEISATVIGDDRSNKNASFIIENRKTANGIINHPVYNERNERIGTVTDIILDRNGQATMVIVEDRAFFGAGKKAAFNYSTITRIERDGDVIMPLTKAAIDNASSFSYDRSERTDTVRVIPANSYSVVQLLDGELINQNNETLADIENISFKNGSADQLIIGFDKLLGMGGETAAFSYSDATIIADGERLNFRLNTQRSAQFEAHKKAVAN